MSNVFLISDTHFGHENILKFKKKDGSPLRPFASLAEMDMAMVENWNRIVTPRDKVYHLGDVAFSQTGLLLIRALNGHKRLVRGNHDTYRTTQYFNHNMFEEIHGVRQIDGYWFTHTPMHQDSVDEKRVKANIHGHLHGNRIDHPKYFNACVENIDYSPISFDVIRAHYQ